MTRIVALLLAAGFGRRFDPSGQTSKLLAPLGSASVAGVSASTLQAADLPVYAVVRPQPQALHAELAATGAHIIESERAAQGMGFSIADGITVIRQLTPMPDGVLICLADMPFIPASVYRQCAAALDDDHRIVAPAFAGRRGHPVGFWHTEFAALAALEGDAGAGRLLKNQNPTLLETACAAVLQDIDQPADLPPAAPT